MIFDFKEELTTSFWDKSQLVTSPPKSFNDYLLSVKTIALDNSILVVPFIAVFAALSSLNFYSYSLSNDIVALEASHRLYQDRRSKILDGKQNLDSINSFVDSLSPYITDSLYPNVFLSFLTPIISSDSSITQLSLTKDSSTLRVASANTDFLSSAFSTLDQHPLIKPIGISFTSIKSSSENQSERPGSLILNDIDIRFSYDFVDISTLSSLFDKNNSFSLHYKASLLK